MTKCNACGCTMTPFSDEENWGMSEDRQCVYAPTRCEDCCRCGGHN